MEQWKKVCRIKDIPLLGVRIVQRGLAWQELPGVALFRGADDYVFALLDRGPQGGSLAQGAASGEVMLCPLRDVLIDSASGAAVARGSGATLTYTVLLDNGDVYLNLDELNAPASRAEAALAGTYALQRHIETV